MEEKLAYRCWACECPEENHDEYWPCMLADGKDICDVCCLYDISSWNIDELVEKRLGKQMSCEEILTVCQKCGINQDTLYTEEEPNIEYDVKYKYVPRPYDDDYIFYDEEDDWDDYWY